MFKSQKYAHDFWHALSNFTIQRQIIRKRAIEQMDRISSVFLTFVLLILFIFLLFFLFIRAEGSIRQAVHTDHLLFTRSKTEQGSVYSGSTLK